MRTIPNPHPPGGDPGGRAVELDARPGRPDVGGAAAGSASAGRAQSAVRTATSSIARRVGIAVALLVRAVEPLREVSSRAAQELERLAAVAEVGLALGRQLARLRERHDVRAHAVAPLVAARARAPRARRPRPGTSTVEIPSSSASSHACSGPAPPKATSAKSRGSCPRSTETTRSARSISAFDDAHDVGRVEVAERPRRRASRSSSSPPAAAGQPAEEEVGVGDRRPRPPRP